MLYYFVKAMTKLRLFFFLFTIAFVGGVGWLVSLFARGYVFDPRSISLKPSGLFVAKSSPDGAQILIDGELESATNATVSLPPDTYDIEIKKEGFLSWRKTLTIKKEEVTQVEAYLFPAAPSLSAITFAGAGNPVISPDRTKIAYGVPAGPHGVPASTDPEKAGIWVMDLVDLPIGFDREPRRITDIPPDDSSWYWSPDSRQILVVWNKEQYLISINEFTSSSQLTLLTTAVLEKSKESWQKEVEKKQKDELALLPPLLMELLENEKSQFVFSPDQKKVMYIPDIDIDLPDQLIAQLPGSSTQKQERSIKQGKTYIYDIKEDRNFEIYDQPVKLINHGALAVLGSETPIEKEPIEALHWFPTSSHLVLAQQDRIIIMDYDGTNKQVVYAGPYQAPFALPFPHPSRLLILTNLGASNGTVANLYSISLR